jgi:hypothetical protein
MTRETGAAYSTYPADSCSSVSFVDIIDDNDQIYVVIS